MHIPCTRLFLFIVLTISWLKHCSCNAIVDGFNSYSSSNLLLNELTKSCPSDGIPVCGIRHYKQYAIFPNECLLREENKHILFGIQNFKKIPLKQCIKNCELQCPKIYRPICALNLETYEKEIFFNLCEVTEHACKTNIEYLKLNIKECDNPIKLRNFAKLLGKRSKSYKRKPIPCTNAFKPVCALYLGVKSTFRNECLLNAENIKYDRDWRIVKAGICSEDYSNVPQIKEKPSKPHYIKKRNYANNNFVHYKSRVPYNDLFVFMPTVYQTKFLNHDVDHPIPIYRAYDDILNKVILLPTPNEAEDTMNPKDQIYEDTENKLMPFAQNQINLNYMPNENFIKNSFPVPAPSAINTFMEDNLNTFEKVEPRRKYAQMAYEQFETNLKAQEKTLKEFERNPQIKHKNVSSKIEATETTAIFTPLETTLPTITEISEIFTHTTSQLEDPTNPKQSKMDKIAKKIKDCKFDITPICGVLPDGTVQTFESMCEMISANVYLTKTWTKLHDGECENCKYKCERDYQPICVARNGVNYTMVNECYFNMGICMDKKSKWKIVSTGECERYTRVPDKYKNIKPGFSYSSSDFNSEAATTAISSTSFTTNKPLRLKSRKPKYHKAFSNRVVNRRFSSSNTNQVPRDSIIKTTEKSTTRLSLYKPQTDSYIMRLVNNKGNI